VLKLFDRTKKPSLRRGWGLLAIPGVVYLVLFFAWPVIGMASRAFTDPVVGFDNFAQFFSRAIAGRSLVLTIETALVVTATCLIVGYPLAYLMVIVGARMAAVLLSVVLVSLWINLVARTFAWEVILRDTGVINRLLLAAGLIDSPLPLIRTPLGVIIGMTHILLPSMILPLYVVMRRIDPTYAQAASSLGASPIRSFALIFFRLSMPGVLAGSLLVFVLALGFYITPFLLGGGQFVMIGQLVVDQVSHVLWGVGSAIALILLVTTLATLAVAARIIRIGDVFGIETGS
jgi:putative spermidine/putrescine transport system permease protein